MKKVYILLLLLVWAGGNKLLAQLDVPQFGPVEKHLIFSSNHEESSPLPVSNGNAIFYNKTYTEVDGENTIVVDQEIRYSVQGKKGWEKPYRLLREDDLPGENLIVGTNRTGTRIYVFNALPDKDTLYRRLYYLDKTDKKYEWSAPTEVIIPGLTYGNDFIHFYVNNEENVILISKPPQGRQNDEDIFVSLKDKNGNWGPIIDVGKTINTSRFELCSYISDDSKLMYFSSEGHGGFGGADIFVSMRLDDSWQKWTKPVNLGEPINSTDYDAFFVMADSSLAYFTSDRNDQHSNIYTSTSTGDISYFEMDSLKGVFVYQGKPVGGVKFIVTDKKGNIVADLITDEFGGFKFEKLDGEEDYLVRIDEEDTDFVGSKIYFLSEEQIKTDRYVYTKDGLFVNSKDLGTNEVVQGVFNYNSLPAIKTGLIVMDENGFPLDTIYTDENGKFNYSALSLESGFSLVPMNMTEDEFVNADIYLLNNDGERIKAMKPSEFHPLEIEEVGLVEIKPAQVKVPTEVVKGVYNYNSLPAIESGLVVKNEDGLPIDTIYTDNEGKFSYSFLDTDDGFSLSPLNMSEDEFVDADIYLTDQKGRRLKTLKPDQIYFLEMDGDVLTLVEESESKGKAEKVKGVYNYNSLPAIESGLVVKNEDGLPIDTIYTDNEGKFSYSFLDTDDGFSLSPLNMSEDEFVNADIYLTDQKGRRLKTLKPDQIYFLEMDGDVLTLVEDKLANNERSHGIDVENVKGAQLEVTAWNAGSDESKTIYFNFEETTPNSEEKNKLSVLVSLIKLDADRKIILTGHTDNSGEADVNNSFGLARAANVRAYLVSKGVPEKSIEVLSEGELNPKADNSTREGRMKNRRVEIKIK